MTASTGNAGAALAGMSAAAGQQAVIFAPRTAPPAKVAQLLIFGAQVILVDGNYDQAFDLTIEAAQDFGWYCRNTGYNPFTAEGKKTAAFEIWEQVPASQPPGRAALTVFVSVGDGNIISGIHKGFKDLQSLGWFEHMPRLFGVQAEGSAAIANAFCAGWRPLPRSRPIPWPTASRSTCRAMACARCAPRARPAARISPSATTRSFRPSPPWAGRDLRRTGRGHRLCRAGQRAAAGAGCAGGPGGGAEHRQRAQGCARRHAGRWRSAGHRADPGCGQDCKLSKNPVRDYKE